MKPLELVWYPLEPSYPAGYALPRNCRIAYRAAIRMAHEKRFAEAELSAEYHRAQWNKNDVQRNGGMSLHQWEVYESMMRFVTLSNYDEVVL